MLRNFKRKLTGNLRKLHRSMSGKYIKLGDLVVYKLAIELSDLGWGIYESLDWKDKKIMGDQFIESTDSGEANIA